MTTDPNLGGLPIPTVDQAQALGVSMLLNDWQQTQTIKRMAMADAIGVPYPSGAGMSFSTTTHNYSVPPPSPPAAPSPAPSAAPAPAPAAPVVAAGSSLLKTAALAAGLATGGAGLLTGGLLLGNLFNKPAIVQPSAAADGQVTIGISPDGKLFNPNP